jgi:hypothetical protein
MLQFKIENRIRGVYPNGVVFIERIGGKGAPKLLRRHTMNKKMALNNIHKIILKIDLDSVAPSLT